MKYLLGIDLGSSSVKVSLVEAESGECISSAHYPESEAPIKALQPGWAEQRPEDWWHYLKMALQKAISNFNFQFSNFNSVAAIGISYQMHGLVCLDKDMQPLRDAIIWCDSRGVPYGEHAPIPGNFTAAKLAWVKEHEPELFEKIRYIMLPGDYLALRLTGTPATTACGLSEMMLWDSKLSTQMMDYFGFPISILPPLVPTFGEQGRVGAAAAKELGINAGIPVTYRAGDQPNNALSLRVLHPGEIASTAGTSGVVYGISQSSIFHSQSEINAFLHVNHTIGLMHCINGCGILNSWLKHNVAADLTYDEMNTLAATVPVGSDGISIIPFGNGAERVLGNKDMLEEMEEVVKIVAKASEKGINPDGSMVHEANVDTGYIDDDPQWWVQAEAVVGFVNLYQHFGDEAALRKALNCWEYIKKNLIDYEHGEWYWSRRKDGTLNLDEDKAGFWKCPYHNGRMCLEILERNF